MCRDRSKAERVGFLVIRNDLILRSAETKRRFDEARLDSAEFIRGNGSGNRALLDRLQLRRCSWIKISVGLHHQKLTRVNRLK